MKCSSVMKGGPRKTNIVGGWRITSGTILVILLGYMCFTSTEGTSFSSSSVYQSGSYSGSVVDAVHRYPCSFRGSFLLHKQSVLLGPCTLCVCNNGTTRCTIESCLSDYKCHSREIVVIPEKCCPQCPYKMVVEDTTNLYEYTFQFREDDTKIMNFSLDVAVDRTLTSKVVRGENLWKLSAWISPNKDGSGRRYSYEDNVFNNRQAASEYSKKDSPPFVWSNLSYNITFKGGTCADYKYVCVRFFKADDPRPKYDLSYTFQAVNNEEERLIDCVPLGQCRDHPSVLKINPNGTITIELPSHATKGITSYCVEYRKMNTTDWIFEEYFENAPTLLTGTIEEGATYELRISLNHGDEYRNPEIFETFTVACRDIDINLELSTSSHRYGGASIMANWNYPNRTEECSITSQTISVKQIDLDNCTDPTDPLNETEILNNDKRYYKRRKLRANTEYNVTVSLEDKHRSYITWKLIRTFETVPTSPPDGISFTSDTKFGRLRIRWNNLPCGMRNSRILSYVVQFTNNRGIRLHNFKDTGATYTGLKIGEPYYFRIAAMNSHGIGPYSPTFAGRFGVK